MEYFRGMYIDENREELNISDHNLVKSWFNIGGEEKTARKKTRYEKIEYYKKDQDSMKKLEEDLMPMIGKKIGFNDLMRKIKISQEIILKVKRRIKVGRRGDTRVLAAEWVDEKLKDNIGRRGRLSRK